MSKVKMVTQPMVYQDYKPVEFLAMCYFEKYKGSGFGKTAEEAETEAIEDLKKNIDFYTKVEVQSVEKEIEVEL